MTRHTVGPTPHARPLVRITRGRVAVAGLVTGTLAVSLLAAHGLSAPEPDRAVAATAASGSVSSGTVVKFRTSKNFVRNWSFGQGKAGWKAPSHAKFVVFENHNDLNRAKLTNRKSSRSVALNDRRNTVVSTKKGATYVAHAYVRTDRPNTSVSLRLMEYDGRTFHGSDRATLFLRDTGWHQLSVDYVARTSSSTIDVNVVGWDLPKGASLYADQISVVSVTKVVVDTDDPPPTDPSTPPTGWRLVWADEFTGDSVNTSKWAVRNNTVGTNELSIHRSSNVSVSNGVLRIQAKKERYSAGGTTREYTSGYLDTIRKASWTYGRFEMRAKLPTRQGESKGMWPAFWLRPDDGGDGEIDIMEAIGQSTSDNRVSQTLWYDYHGTKPRQVHEDRLPSGTSSGSYHVYALEWEKSEMRWYVDGRLTYTRNTSTTPWITAKQFTKPYNIRLNLQVGGSWPGSPDASTAWPQTYSVDYVRVYKR
jgi:beta-glucanase (GH16 family)